MAGDNKTTNITISSDDIRSLGGAAESMRAAADGIASAVGEIKGTVESLERAIVEMADEIDEAQDAADYDAKVRADAERMHAEATGALHVDDKDASLDKVLDAISGMKQVIGDWIESNDSRGDESAMAEAIIGDTALGSAADIGGDILDRLDSAIDIFSTMNAQLGTIKTWVDGNMAVQAVNTRPDDAEPEPDEPLQDAPAQVSDPALMQLSDQFAALSGSIESLGDRIVEYVAAAREPVEVPDVRAVGSGLTDTEAGDADGIGDVSEYAAIPDSIDRGTELLDGRLSGLSSVGTDTNTLLGDIYDELTSRQEPVAGGDDTIVSRIDRIAELLDGLPDRIQLPQEEPHEQAQSADRVTEIVDRQSETIERMSERVLNERDVVDERVTVERGDETDYSGILGDMQESLAGIYRNTDREPVNVEQSNVDLGPVIDAIGGLEDVLGDNFADMSMYGMADDAPEIVPGVDSQPVQTDIGQIDPNGPTTGISRAIGVPDPLSNVHFPGTVIGERPDDMTNQGLLDDLLGALRDIGTSGMNDMGIPEEVSVNSDRDIPQAGTEIDRYGDSAAKTEQQNSSPAQDRINENRAGDTVEVNNSTSISHNVNVDLTGENANIIRRATMEGMVDALLDSRFRGMMEDAISNMVRQTVKAIVG